MNSNNLIKNISLTFIANIVSLLVSLLSTMFVPKMTGVTAYGYWQLYLFYISYAGILHLGLCDGVYLTNGGKLYSQLDKRSLRYQFYILLSYLTLLCIVVVIVGSLCSDDSNTTRVLFLACMGAFFHVLKTYLMLVLQASNRLKEYSAITILDRIVFIIGLIILIMTGMITYTNIIFCDISGRVMALILAIYYTKDIVIGKIGPYSKGIKDFKENIYCGSQLLLSGIASNLIIGFIRMGIKVKWDIEEFGKVSLSLSVINMVLSFINMAAIVFFPILKRLSNEIQKEIYKKAEFLIVSFAFGILIFAGVGKTTISVWLPQYSESMVYMILLLPICIFESETSMLLNTYLKATRKEQELLLVNIVVMFISTIFTYISTCMLGNLKLSLIGIDMLLMIRAFLLKRIVYSEFNFDGYLKIISAEMMLLIIYLLLYYKLETKLASIIYLVVFLIFGTINNKKIKEGILYFYRNI